MGQFRIFFSLMLMIFGIVFVTGCEKTIADAETNLGIPDEGGDETMKEPVEKHLDAKKPQLRKDFIAKKYKTINSDTGMKEFFDTELKLTKGNGELNISFRLVNTSLEPLTFIFSSSQEYDFAVYNEQNEKVYQWSVGKAFLAVMKEVTLDPGDSLTYNPVWKFVDQKGMSLPEGKYRVEFVLTGKVTDKVGKILHGEKKASAVIDTRVQ